MSIASIANSEPKYLGCRVGQEEYYFFSMKDGKGRFLKYVAYPLWCRSSDVSDVLDISKPVADDILEEVHSFILGKLQIEVIPKKRGRSEKIIKTNLNLGITNNDDNINGSGRDSISITSKSPGNGRSGSTDGAVRIENRLSESGRGSNNLPQSPDKSSAENTADSTRACSDKERKHPKLLGNAESKSGIRKKSVPVVKTSVPPVVVAVEKQKRVRRTKLQMEEARRLVSQVVQPVVKEDKGKRNK